MEDLKNILTILLVGAAIGLLFGKLAPKTAKRFSLWSQKPELWKLHALSTVLFSIGLVLAIAEMNIKHICLGVPLVAVCGTAMLRALRHRST